MKEKKKVLILTSVIVVVILLVGGIIFTLNIVEDMENKVDISQIIKEGKSAVIYVENSDEKKCKDCDKIKKHLDTKKMEYQVYDCSKYSEKEYKTMLNTLTINPNDFHYPAVIYIKEGKIYSDIINIHDTKLVDQFIKEYHLEK